MMKTVQSDPVVAEVRAAREKHAEQFSYDIKEIFKSIRAQQMASNRKYTRYPARRLERPASESPSHV